MLDVSPTVTTHRRSMRTDTVNLIGILLLRAARIQSVSEDIVIVLFEHQDRHIEKKIPDLTNFASDLVGIRYAQK